jgi:hypothetical protein
MSVDVVLQDFDGSRTIVSTDVPLPETIRNTETDLGLAVGKIYVKTNALDDHGRVVYNETI